MLNILKVLINKIKGPLRVAKSQGMHVGNNVTVMGNANFGSEPYLITIHDNVRISCNVTFITHDGGNFAFRHLEGYENVNHFGKIIVEEHTFIGAGATIMPGVRIGKNCVIGAGALVTKSVPDFTVVAGVPAKTVCSTMEYAEKMKLRMPDNWNVDQYKLNKSQYLIDNIEDPT